MLVALAAWSFAVSPSANADILATGFFSGTIERFDQETGAQSTFADLKTSPADFPGLSGIAFDASLNRVYASARIGGGVYSLDAITGSVLGFQSFDPANQPAGVAVDAASNIYVANSGLNTVGVFDSAWNALSTITLPTANDLPSGLAFDDQNRLLITTFNQSAATGSIFRFNPADDSVVVFADNLFPMNQAAVDAIGNVYAGGVALSSDVVKLAGDGSTVSNPFITIDEALLPVPPRPFTSPDFTSPGGITIDADGNLIVAALGRTNPFSGDPVDPTNDVGDNFQSNGGLWKFSPDGVLLETFPGTGSLTPLSSVAIVTAIPEPGSLAVLSLGALACRSLRRRRKRESGFGN